MKSNCRPKGLWLAAVGLLAAGSGQAAAPEKYQALLDRYCTRCHNNIDNLPAGKPLYLDEVDLGNVGAAADTWELVVRKLGVGAMPPQGRPHPGVAEMQEFRNYLIGELDKAAAAKKYAGNYVMHRLNRGEYANAVRDLLGIEVDVSALLPPDGSDFGFDNVASGLQVTPALLERYFTAAVRISDLAVGDPQAEAAETKFPIRVDLNQISYVPGMPPGTRGGTVVTHNFPADGEYQLSGTLYRTVDSADAGLSANEFPVDFVVLVDGRKVHSTSIGGPEQHMNTQMNIGAARAEAGERMKVKTFITAGPHEVAFTFVERAAVSQDIFAPLRRNSQDIHVAGPARLSSASIIGPLKATGVSASSHRERLYVCDPKAPAEESACAQRILSTLARRAYRRPVTEEDMAPIMAFYEQGRSNGGGFHAGLRTAVARVLTSLSFIYRSESDPESLAAGVAHPVSDVELASRLSFFLWSSIPDDELLDIAAKGKLRSRGVLEQQVRRMLMDPRAKALTRNFPDQWLALRNLDRTTPDLYGFPNWDYTLRLDLQEETRLFFESIVRENRSALDLLTADYTFVNERVARHYGIKDVYGPNFRRIQLDDPHRRGLLGQASILALTSVATRTSPVFRGKWILTNLLNTPPLPPPDDVPALEENTGAQAPKSVRERLEKHRENSVCASCHNSMDPLGLALENFDATGRWRDVTEAGTPVDASGVLVDGTPITGPDALRDALASRPDVFTATVTEKLLIYALGRGLQAPDLAVVRDIVRQSARDGYRFQSLIQGIVASQPFQMRTKPGGESVITAQNNVATKE